MIYTKIFCDRPLDIYFRHPVRRSFSFFVLTDLSQPRPPLIQWIVIEVVPTVPFYAWSSLNLLARFSDHSICLTFVKDFSPTLIVSSQIPELRGPGTHIFSVFARADSNSPIILEIFSSRAASSPAV